MSNAQHRRRFPALRAVASAARPSTFSRPVLLAAAGAIVITGLTVTVGVIQHDPGAGAAALTAAESPAQLEERRPEISRSFRRDTQQKIARDPRTTPIGKCTNGTVVPSSVSDAIARVHEAVCSVFPDITTYGTLRGGGGDHPLGRAVDIMVSGAEGKAVADFVRAHAAELGVAYVIYQQHIWSVERGSEGWRLMENRGSATANHYDHVHVSTY